MNTKEWGMFTAEGNWLVEVIVRTTIKDGTGFAGACKKLEAIAEVEGFGEATDTEVRELVYSALENT